MSSVTVMAAEPVEAPIAVCLILCEHRLLCFFVALVSIVHPFFDHVVDSCYFNHAPVAASFSFSLILYELGII